MKRIGCTVFAAGIFLSVTAPGLRAQTAPRLVGWWRMDDATGATALADSSGGGRNATLGSGVSIVDGKFGKAARFDGTGNAWAQFSQPAFSNLTVAAWIYVDGIPANPLPRIMQLAGEFYYHMPSNILGQFTFGKSNDGAFSWTSTGQDPFKYKTNTWFHTAIVVQQQYTSATDRVFWATFYINGVRCGDPTPRNAFIQIPSGTGTFGNNGINGSRPLNGLMDEVRLYDASLSDREILALYQNSPLAVDAGKDQACYRETTFLQGRLINTNPFMRDLSAGTAWSVVSAPEGAAPAIQAPWLPVSSVTLPAAGTYVLRLTASNELGVAADDVTLVRHTEAPPEGNAEPTVTPLWTSTNTVLGAGAPLAATVADDGNPGALRVRWSKASGPGAAFFDNPFATNTFAHFSTNGTYVLALEADDGALTWSANVTVTVTLPTGNLSDGLVHWWRMDDDPALKKAFDSVGANTLSLTNQAFLQPGKTGYGYRGPKLDAVGVAASLPTNAETMTFSAWFFHDDGYVNRANGNRYQRLLNCGPNFYILYDPVVRQISLSTRGVGTGDTQHNWAWPEMGLTSNRWFHIAVLFDRRAAASGSRQVLYLNGQRVLSNLNNTAFPGAAAFTSAFIIANTGATGGTRNFDGVLDDMRVYSRFITDEEALLLATDPDNNHAPVIEVPAGLTAKVGRPIALQGAATDDGQPFGKTLAARWTVASGDASKVLFADALAPDTTATFTRTGEYALMLSASDGEQQAASLVRVAVVPTGTLISVW